MTLLRMDNVAVVVEDLDGAVAFFKELGMELEGRATVEGDWVDRIVGLHGTRSDIAMMRTPDGHGRLELTRYQHPAAVGPDPGSEPPNTRGMNRVMFAGHDVEDVVERLKPRGGGLVGEIVKSKNAPRRASRRGPGGLVRGPAEPRPGRPPASARGRRVRGRQIPVFHLPGVVEHVVGAPTEQELDGPAPRRHASRVVLADRRRKRLAVRADLVAVLLRVLPYIRRRDHADLFCELLDLGAVRMTHDSVAVASAASRALPKLCRDARSDLIEPAPA